MSVGQAGGCSRRRRAVLCLALAAPIVLSSCGAGEGPADLVFVGGPILTMIDSTGVPEAVAVADGRILALGPREVILSRAGSETVIVDLGGRALLPGFIDAHGHFTEVAQIIDDADIQSPPAGPVNSIEDIVSVLRARIGRDGIRVGDWVVGAGYDERLLAERRHPTMQDLDRVSSAHPVVAIHASGRMGCLNSRAWQILSSTPVLEATDDSDTDRRPGSGEPTGLLRERAFFRVRKLIRSNLDPVLRLHRVRRAGELYARYGVTTTQDGGIDEDEFKLLVTADQAGALPIDVVCLPESDRAEGLLRRWGEYRGFSGSRLRIGGVSTTLDRPPERGGAWLTTPYATPPAGREPGYMGEPNFADGNVVSFLFHSFLSQRVQVFAHVNGDAAADQMIAAVDNALAMIGPGDYRPIMVYAHVVREDQLDRMAELGISPSFSPSQLYFWGDVYLDSLLGGERTGRLSPCRSARDRGLRFSIHNDEPDVPPNVLFLIANAVERRSRGGRVIGADQRIDVADALRAVTSGAAWQIFEEDRKGTIEVGKLADFTILSDNPLDVDPARIDQIGVVATYKEGTLVHRAP